MNQKGFASIILVVVIVILVSVVGYFAFVKKSEQVAQQPTSTPTPTPSPDPTPNPTINTTNWESWTNSTNKFVVKIPRDWKIQQLDAGGGSLVQIFAPNSSKDKIRITLPQLEFTYDLKDSEITTIKAVEGTFVKNPGQTQIQNSEVIP